jgi:hypothetical protein
MHVALESPPLCRWWCWSPCSTKCHRGTRYPGHRAAGSSYVLLVLCIIGTMPPRSRGLLLAASGIKCGGPRQALAQKFEVQQLQ